MTDVADPYGLGDENTQPTPPVPDRETGDPLEHGLETAGDPYLEGEAPRRLEVGEEVEGEGLEFGLGSSNTQDAPQTGTGDDPNPLEHGLGER